MLYDFPKDARIGLNLAFYRVFAIPGIANLLVRTGEMLGRPAKRGYDTGLVMYELITHGFDHPRGREMVRLLNRVHRPWPITDEDYRYVLAAFIVVPMRWIEKRGWRTLLPAEREASATFYRELGRRMNITDLPSDYAAAAALLDAYEARNMAPSHSGAQLMDTTQQFLVRKLPRRLQRLGPVVTSALLDDPPLTQALGLPRPPRGVRFCRRPHLHPAKYPHSTPEARHRLVVRPRAASQHRLPARLPTRRPRTRRTPLTYL